MQFQISFSLFLLSIGLIATRGQGAYYGGNTYYKCMGCCYGLRLYVRCSDVCALNPACYVNDHCWNECVKSVCVFGYGYGHSINKNRDATLARCLKQCTVCPRPSPTTTTSTSTTTTTTTLPPVCSLPPPTDNGVFVIDPPPADGSTSVMVNAIVTYTCNTCYKSDDALTYTCKPTGNYDPSGIPPTCSKVRCQGIPQAPEGGSVSTQDNTCGTLVVYSCDSCSNVVGSATRTCLENGEWSSEEPTCEKVRCQGIPQAPEGGSVSTQDNTCGTLVVYSCDSCSNLVGSATRTCLENGEWSSEEPTCKKVRCQGIPQAPEGGSVSTQDNTCGTLVVYSCDSCSNLVGSATRTCLENGEWSSEEPTCEKVRCQGIPQAPEGGSVSTQDNTCGTLVVYSCDSCSNLVGSATRTCLENGEWSSEEPTCEKLSCDPIRAPENGQRSPPQGNEECNDKISFECNEGYEVKGAETIICTRAPGSSPQWNEAPPICYPICGKWVKVPCGDCKTESHRQRCGTQKCSWVCEKCGSVRDYWRDPPGKKRDVVVSKRDFKFDSACTIGDRKEVSNFCCHFRK
ncbi:unnamed protein product [Owenia fusiformis]|uniref:Sushi domain-containing protein n=1 Tax=Owenia fusiformis TaxID=6347 RepID=A0A8S4Q1U1_OWEFU|nr:unnamed protein product [Owenia fusiformis]